MLGSAAIFASIISVFFVKVEKEGKVMSALYRGVGGSTVLSLIAFYYITGFLMGDSRFFYVTVAGVVITVLMVIVTEYYTSKSCRPVKTIAASSETGAATNIISGLSAGFESTLVPAVVIAAGILVSYFIVGGSADPPGTGLYGIAIASVAMLSTAGMIVALDSYGPITDNAGGIAQMANLPAQVRKVTDELDSVGNTTKAVTKGYAIGSTALGALALFADYRNKVSLESQSISLDSPVVLSGILLGAVLPFLFSAVMMSAVGKAAFEVVNEVRRQFREIPPGIMEGTAKPEYGRCVDIVTKAALHDMAMPGFLAVIIPFLQDFSWVLKHWQGFLQADCSGVHACPHDGQRRRSLG